MSEKNEFAAKITSGLDVVDRAWGGLFKGGSYLVYGRVSNGRGLLALAFEQAGVALGERAMFVSSAREKDLQIQSTAIGFNVISANENSLFRHVRTRDLAPSNPESASARIEHLTELILDFRPARLVVNDLVSLINVGTELSLGEFRNHFVELLERIEPIETTAVFTLPEPGNDSARKLAEFIMSRCAGAIHVGARERDSEGYKLTLLPQLGHVTRRTVVSWPLHDVVSRFEDVEGSYRALMQQRHAALAQLKNRSDSAVVEREPSREPTSHREPPMSETTDTVQASTLDDLATGLGLGEAFPTSLTLEEAQSRRQVRRDAPRRSPTDFQNRARFAESLKGQFSQLATGGAPFLLVAMRVDPTREPVRPFDFEFLSGVVLETLRSADDAFVDLQKERLVLLFPGSNADDSQEFFSRVRSRLREDAPQQAAHLLNLVSAIVVPNGNPFSSADAFLNYVLDAN
ncbi:MAG: ATPase domain-containing protein [Rhodothermales bacterium]